jgi:ketosteroid isomerase-like protein
MTRLMAMAFAICMLGSGMVAGAEKSAQDKKDHEELRALLKTFTQAFNSRQIEPLVPYLHKDFTVTMVTQDLITTPQDMRTYLDNKFTGPTALLKDVQIQPEPDIPTVFIQGRIGINRGGSTDTYTLRDGRVFVLKTRWTGTAIKEGGRWKVLNAHIGVNFVDNPVLDAVDKLKWVWAAVAGAIGLAVGVLGTLLLKRRKA